MSHPIFDPEMKEILDSFLIETKEILDKLDQDLLQMEQSSEDKELINTVFRAFHTVKGTSGFLGFDQMMEITHKCEDVLNKIRKGELAVTSEMMDVIFESFDIMKELIARLDHGSMEPVEMDETLAKLLEISEGHAAEPAAAAPAPSKQTDELPPEIQAQIDALMRGENVEPASEAGDDDAPVQVEDARAATDERGPVQREQAAGKQKTAVARATEKSADNTIRVDVQRLDNLMNLVGELVLGRNRLSQITNQYAQEHEGTLVAKDLSETNSQIDFITTELQTAIMKTRMVPIGKVFNKFPRVVRDLAKETEKQIDLVIIGEETELDKSIIDEINDPLVHLVRNAADHGVERPEKRAAKGKPAKGTITLKAENEGNTIVVSIRDDGNGMDPEILKAKAIEKGLITDAEAKEMTKHDALNLIFAPGFSTAAKVTNVSGRGVGMDVVKTNVQKLKGVIEIESELGTGSIFTIKLPLTLAIIQGLLVTVRDNTFAVPLTSVLEVVRIRKNEIYTVGGNEVIRLRDKVLPLARLDHLLVVNGETIDDREWMYVVVIALAEKNLGLVVDSLLGQKEVVIKSLGEYFSNSRGIAGSTILGDGRVIMIVDVSELFNLAHAI
ncbi:MAG TPA: chemotaxis protein CheA [Bacteroidota bacterium]|nr:chemotaxis protein CheA [Bacteroidota bacterium]